MGLSARRERKRHGLKFFVPSKRHLNAPADNKGVTAPRQVIPGETFMITRRISERRFFLRPDRNVNNIVEFCIGLATKKLFRRQLSKHLRIQPPLRRKLPNFAFVLCKPIPYLMLHRTTQNAA